MATLLHNISALVLPHADEGKTRAPVDVIYNAALLIDNGAVLARGAQAEVAGLPEARAAEAVDLQQRAVLPGLIDSHTHVVFGGERIDEMARRARGESYEEIAQAGGGIVRSVDGIDNNSIEEIARQSRRRLDAMLRRGVTTCEVKTGYGLEPALERKHLDAIALVATQTPIDLRATLLAHVIPKAARGDRPAFVERFCREVIERCAAAPGVYYADVFIEEGAYTQSEAQQIVRAAAAFGLRAKLHVDQLRDGGGAAFAARLGALSADHLEFSSADGRRALAEAGVIAAILPGCPLYLGKGPWPDGAALRAAGCEVAVATDCNPGSSMLTDLPLCATLAATRCGLTLEEALWGITCGGAKALGLSDRGTLEPGTRADFVVLDHEDWRALLYRAGDAPVAAVYIAGTQVV